VENNPIRYIDPFGLDKEDREKRRQKRRERRRKRRENRERKKYVDPEKREYYIPEVAVYASKPKPKAGPLVALIWNVEQLIRGNHNPTKTRKATWFEEWAIKHFDMSEILRLADILGDGRGEGTNNNKVETDAYYEGPTSDEKINESASNNNELIKNEVDKRSGIVKIEEKEKNAKRIIGVKTTSDTIRSIIDGEVLFLPGDTIAFTIQNE